MRIDDLNSAPLPPEPGRTQPASEKIQPEYDPKASGNADQADLSRLARALSNDPPSRIEQLRMEVQSGKYEVPASEVAKAIIDHHSRK